MNMPLAGSSIDTAVVINASDSFEAVERENAWLSQRFGRRGFDWVKNGQMLVKNAGRTFDRIEVETHVGPRSVCGLFSPRITVAYQKGLSSFGVVERLNDSWRSNAVRDRIDKLVELVGHSLHAAGRLTANCREHQAFLKCPFWVMN